MVDKNTHLFSDKSVKDHQLILCLEGMNAISDFADVGQWTSRLLLSIDVKKKKKLAVLLNKFIAVIVTGKTSEQQKS